MTPDNHVSREMAITQNRASTVADVAADAVAVAVLQDQARTTSQVTKNQKKKSKKSKRAFDHPDRSATIELTRLRSTRSKEPAVNLRYVTALSA